MYEYAVGREPDGGSVALGDQLGSLKRQSTNAVEPSKAMANSLSNANGLACAGLAVAGGASMAGSILAFPYVAIAIAGLGLNIWAVMRLERLAVLAHGPRRELLQFQTLTLDIVSIFFLATLLSTSGILETSSAVAVAVIYVVILLCALIKCYALNKLAYPKLYRAGKVVKVGACLVILAKLTQQYSFASVMAFSLDLPNLIVMAALVLTIASSVKHAARVRALLALRDPRPSVPATIATVA